MYSDWDKIRAEYIKGGISQRKLAEKTGVTEWALRKRAAVEGWTALREEARRKSVDLVVQRTAEVAADNAALAQSIKRKLLLRLDKEIDNLPADPIGSAAFASEERHELDPKTQKPIKRRSGIEYKIRELAAAYKDLTADMQPEAEDGSDILAGILDVLSRRRDEHD